MFSYVTLLQNSRYRSLNQEPCMNLFNTLWNLHASVWYTRTCCKWRMAYTLFAKQITLKIKAALTGVTMTTVRAVLSDIQQKSKFPLGKKSESKLQLISWCEWKSYCGQLFWTFNFISWMIRIYSLLVWAKIIELGDFFHCTSSNVGKVVKLGVYM